MSFKTKLLGIAMAVVGVIGVGAFAYQTNAAVDTTRDCDKYAVIYCGTMSVNEARNKYHQASKIFGAMGIQKSEITHNMKNGVVYKDGRVVVGGKTVATNARTAIRNMSGGNKISGTNAAIYPTSRMGSAQAAIVKFDSNGRFMFAIMTPCGNPVVGNPTKPKPKPAAACKSLTVDRLSRTKFRFNASATVKNGAKVKSYTYVVKKGGKTVLNKTTKSAKITYNASQPGDYKVRLKVNTTEGTKTHNTRCVKTFTVKQQNKPGVDIEKTVNGKELEQVEVNEEFIYQLVVTNTGNTVLKNVAVTDEAPEHVQFISTDKGSIVNNSLSYTIPQLGVNGTHVINITAKAISEDADAAVNTACVDAPGVPGSPDDCDDATIEVPIEVCDLTINEIITIDQDEFNPEQHSTNFADCEEVKVCDPETGEIITVAGSEADNYAPVDSDKCKEKEQPEVPAELPETGPAETAFSIASLGVLIASSYYYVASRRTVS